MLEEDWNKLYVRVKVKHFTRFGDRRGIGFSQVLEYPIRTQITESNSYRDSITLQDRFPDGLWQSRR